MTGTGSPLVSIITPAYNCSAYVVQAMNSVRSQTFGDWEHLIVDDGSVDATVEAARSVIAEERRTRVLRHPDRGNHGVSATRNLGLSEARGSLVAFLDADDEWLPQMLATQVSVFKKSATTTLAFAKARCIDGDGEPLQHPDWPHLEWVIGHAPRRGIQNDAFDDFISRTTSIPIVTALARREEVALIGGFVESLRFQVEDAVLLGQLCRTGVVHFTDELLARYRVHSDNFTSHLDPLSTADSIWELYLHLADDPTRIEPSLARQMLYCVDRYLTAERVPWRIRCQRARRIRKLLTEWGVFPASQVRYRFALALPRYFKQSIAIGMRRRARIGPQPWREWRNR